MNVWQPYLRDMLINHLFGPLRGEPIPKPGEFRLNFPAEELVGTYRGPIGLDINVFLEGARLICAGVGSAPDRKIRIELERDEKVGLRIASEAEHHSLGFFRVEEPPGLGMMLGMTALRKS